MYLPAHFAEHDRDRILRLMRGYPFVTLITATEGGIEAQHLPVLVETDGTDGAIRLLGHLARANPACAALAAGSEVLAVFHGPGAYISPELYQHPGVPTWNYAAVHVYGRPRLIEDAAALQDLVWRQTAREEETNGTNWTPNRLSPEQRESLISKIVGFEIPVARLEAKFKLSQNRPEADRRAVIGHLAASPDAAARQMARLMADSADQ